TRGAYRLCSLLQARILHLSPDRGALRMARRDVVPRRRHWRDDRHYIVHPCPPNTALCLLRYHYRGNPSRSVLWPRCEFHQWRAVWATERCSMGHDLPLWRPGAASSEPALRSALRSHTPVPPAVCRRTPECPTAPRIRYGTFSRGLRGCPHVGRTLPGAGPTAWFSDFRNHHGSAFVDPAVDRRDPEHHLGAARSGPCSIVT